jgi:hypothetical protein
MHEYFRWLCGNFSYITLEPLGRAVAQEVSRWHHTAATRIRVRAACGACSWTKRHWGRFSLSTSVSLANHHPTNFSIIIITRGWHNRTISSRSAEWTQLDSTPTIPIYKISSCYSFVHIFTYRLFNGTKKNKTHYVFSTEWWEEFLENNQLLT